MSRHGSWVSRIVELFWTAFWGLLPQGLTLAAMLMPLVFGLDSELVSLVLISGIATLVVHPATLGSLSVFAAVRSPKKAAATMVASILCLFVASALLATAGVAAFLLGSLFFYETAIYSALVLFCQGAYYLVLSYATRLGSYERIVRIRLVYGVFSFVAMLVGSTIWLSEYSLPLAAAAAFGGTTLIALHSVRYQIPWRFLTAVGFPAALDRAWELRKDAAVFLLAGLSGQSSSLALAFLGPLAVPFATATRLANGFQTVGAQVIAPKFDIDYARALRSRNASETARIYDRGTLWGVGLGILGVLTALALVVYTDDFARLSELQRATICGAIIFFWGTQIAASVVGKFLTFGGFSGVRLWNELARALPLVAILVFLRESDLLIGLSLVMSISMVVFIYLGRRHSRAPVDPEPSK